MPSEDDIRATQVSKLTTQQFIMFSINLNYSFYAAFDHRELFSIDSFVHIEMSIHLIKSLPDSGTTSHQHDFPALLKKNCSSKI